jgi:hypothetical protein
VCQDDGMTRPTVQLRENRRSRWIFVSGLSFLILTILSGCALMKNRKMRSSGIEARAIITSVADTRTRVNDTPVFAFELRVQGEDGHWFEASARQVVALHEIPQVQPGQAVTVRYDPDAPQRAVIVAIGHALGEETARRLLEDAEAIRAHVNQPGVGAPAMGIVISFEDLGVTVNEVGTLVELAIKVVPEGGAAYDARIVLAVLVGREENYAPGRELDVLYDPDEPAMVHLDESRATSCVSRGPSHVQCRD